MNSSNLASQSSQLAGTKKLGRSVVNSSNNSYGHIKPLTNTQGIQNNYSHNTTQFFTVSNNQDSGAEAEIILNMNKNTYQINLGNKKATFMLNDPIFLLEEQTKSVCFKDTKCISCDKDLERKNKHFCQFCGHGACKKCAFKLRPF